MKNVLFLLIAFSVQLHAQVSYYDLRYPASVWKAASVPRNAVDSFGQILFPEADFTDSLITLYNEAKLAWYNIDPLFLRNNSATPDYIKNNPLLQQNHYAREIDESEIKDSVSPIISSVLTFDLAFYPNERGAYNYENSSNGSAFSAGMDSNGNLKDPASRWGGIMRAMDQTDFASDHITAITFWLLDPFIYDSINSGEFYINLGNISEDYIRDGRRFAEGNLTCNDTVNSPWGIEPQLPFPASNQLTNSCQDVGFDGLDDNDERTFFSDYLDMLSTFVQTDALQNFYNDPSGDNYHYYLGSDYDALPLNILERYKQYREADNSSALESEDLNGDKALEEPEQYYQYRIEVKPHMQVGESFIVDKRTVTGTTQNPNDSPAVWYQFRIPVNQYDTRIGQIPDFRSIRYMRIFLTGFEDPVVFRFARLELERNGVTSIADNLKPVFELYPNPCSGKFIISSVNGEIKSISVFDMLGQTIAPNQITKSGNSKTIEVDVGNVKGIYLVKIESSQGVNTYKVLIQ